MSREFVRESALQFLLTLWHVLPWMAAMGAVFSVLSLFMPCNPGRHWWRKKGLVTDFAYWIFVPVFTRYLRIWLTVMGIAIKALYVTLKRRGIPAAFVGFFLFSLLWDVVFSPFGAEARYIMPSMICVALWVLGGSRHKPGSSGSESVGAAL